MITSKYQRVRTKSQMLNYKKEISVLSNKRDIFFKIPKRLCNGTKLLIHQKRDQLESNTF